MITRSVYHLNRKLKLSIIIQSMNNRVNILNGIVLLRSITVKEEKKKKTKDGKIDFRSGQPRLVAQISKNSKPDSSTSKNQEAKKQIDNSNANVTISDIKSKLKKSTV